MSWFENTLSKFNLKPSLTNPGPTEDDDDDDFYTIESTGVSDVEVKEKEPKKSKNNYIETKTIDALKNAATAVIFMNLFTIHCNQNGVDPTLNTIMDNGAASNELFQLLQPTMNSPRCDKKHQSHYELQQCNQSGNEQREDEPSNNVDVPASNTNLHSQPSHDDSDT
ncbi:hypothetical protein ACTFIW_001023 [Dictyostelium discoideum]